MLGATPPTPPDISDDSWADVSRHALALAAALRTISQGHVSKTEAVCVDYAELVDEIARFADAKGAVTQSKRLGLELTRKQLQDFARLLRDKRNQAGFSRIQLARKAQVSDATIKFIETARHPPSRATLLRLVGVAELGLRWADTPGNRPRTLSADTAVAQPALPEPDCSPFDSRLTQPMVLESLLILDELRSGQHAVEVTAYGARRLCYFCGARSEAWTVNTHEAVKLPLRHATPCAGRLTDSLWQRFPVISELAQEERRSLRSPTATALKTSLQEIHRERFFGCRSGADVVALLARVTSLTTTPYRAGVAAMLLWTLAMGPCPVEPAQKPFSEHRAQRLAQLIAKRGLAQAGESSRLRGVCEAAAWIIEPQAAEPPLEQGLSRPSEGSSP